MAVDNSKIMEIASGNLDKFMMAQKELSGTGLADKGQIKIVLSGEINIKELSIAPEVTAKRSAEEISRLIITAYNRARADLDTQLKEATRKMIK